MLRAPISLVFILLAAPTFAQQVDPFALMFGAMAQQQGARNVVAWRQFDERELACIDAEMARQGMSLRRIISNGVSPDDPMLVAPRSRCARARGNVLTPDPSVASDLHASIPVASTIDFTLRCRPSEPSSDSDPIVSTTIAVTAGRLSIVHRAASGAEYHRGDQYIASPGSADARQKALIWSGVLRTRPNIRMDGRTSLDAGGRVLYTETVTDLNLGRVTDGSTSLCTASSDGLAAAMPPVAPTVVHQTFTASPGTGDLALDCSPTTISSDPDPIALTTIQISGGRLSIVHRMASGTEYHRADQYEARSVTADARRRAIEWTGVRRNRPTLSMVGTTKVDARGRLIYSEGVFDTRTKRQTDSWNAECRIATPPNLAVAAGTRPGTSGIAALNSTQAFAPVPDAMAAGTGVGSSAATSNGGASATTGQGSPPPAPAVVLRADDPRMVAARDLLADLKAYLADRGVVPGIADLSRVALQLQSALEAGDLLRLTEARRKLDEAVRSLQGFEAYVSDRRELRQREEARILSQAEAEAQLGLFFIDRYMANNFATQAAARLLPIQESLAHALKLKSASDLRAANQALAAQVQTEPLKSDYDLAAKAYAERQRPPEPPRPPASLSERLGLGPTAREVVEGDPAAVLILFDASGRAPNLTRTLDGDFRFKDNIATACIVAAKVEAADRLALARLLARPGLNVEVAPTACGTGRVTSDFVGFRRADLRADTPESLAFYGRALDKGDLKLHRNMAGNEYDETVRAAATRGMEIEAAIEAGRATGWSVLVVSDKTPILCVEELQDPAKNRAAIELLGRESRAIWPGLPPGGSARRLSLGAEAMFVGVQKRSCGAVTGTAETVRKLMTAMRRDALPYAAAPVLVEASAIDAEASAIRARDAEAIAAEEDRARASRDAAQLAERRQAQAAAERDAVEARLRAQNGATARGLLEKVRLLLEKQAAGSAPVSFDGLTPITQSQASRAEDGWTVVKREIEVDDYGHAQFKGRALEAIVARWRITQKNNVLGEFSEDCWQVALLDDREFNMLRELVSVRCDVGEAALMRWRTGLVFRSGWRAAQE
ncbi:hypothetical protein [Prosthecodimorpha staleyi]|uniref:Uncharacterized protein n=1 Tax=Prosthecodimorpha staleyi TaxID=2840188 RepID=A0A947DAU7_9HYPH|nr:hypothetical protein [Prosthecodimorpha staleyi]MBT9291832.1 hypothetical protein [Prosthecodimorpha staleyi]